MDEMPRLQTGPEEFGRPALSGGLGKSSLGGIVTPPRRPKGRGRKPSTFQAGAPELYPNPEETGSNG